MDLPTRHEQLARIGNPCNAHVTKDRFQEWVNRKTAFVQIRQKISSRPVAIIMVGGPASGKSLAQSECVKQLGLRATVVVDPDEVLADLFQLDNGCYWDENLPPDEVDVRKATNLWLDAVVSTNQSFVYDTTGRNYTFIRDVIMPKLRNYAIIFCYCESNIEVAQKRAQKRAEETGRSVDIDYLQKTYDTIPEAVEEYRALVRSKKADALVHFKNNAECSRSNPCPIVFEKVTLN